jgi:outer membrane protein TolC
MGTAGTQQGLSRQPIVTGGKPRASRSRHEVDVVIAHRDCHRQQLRVINGVRLRFLPIMARQQMLELRSASTRLSDEVVRAVREEVATGHASEPDILMAENDAAQPRLDVDQLRDRHLNSWREFAAFPKAI